MGLRAMIVLGAVLSGVNLPALATTYDLPVKDSRIVGNLQYHMVKKGESMAQIAKQYDVGFLALMAANKGVDPFLPKAGYVLTIPSQIILPDVDYQGVVINLAELRLYYFEPNQHTVSVFPVGIGRIGRDTPVMKTAISQKRAHPTWTPPQSIRAEYEKKGKTLPAVVPAGPDNPLGNYALRLAYGDGTYLIHGTNKNFGIGLRVSSGCIRMEPKNIKWLFNQVHTGTKVRVINDPVKVSLEPDHHVYLEAHEPLTRSNGTKEHLVVPAELGWWLKEFNQSKSRSKAAIMAKNGVPVSVASRD
ncbi:putative L,D-transpeptidase YcfS precursor [Vibrio palustris]|uniref:Putative L,D-transpeptidase YcfS n=2 Tax=Vibrio palustris TaxID=1918946 RepID=A0A1R4B667_9VIBR|nr:putative L,D-transpeptidase YcfS precursor [Vibrio palustris]